MIMRRTAQRTEKNALFGGDVWPSAWIYRVSEKWPHFYLPTISNSVCTPCALYVVQCRRAGTDTDNVATHKLRVSQCLASTYSSTRQVGRGAVTSRTFCSFSV